MGLWSALHKVRAGQDRVLTDGRNHGHCLAPSGAWSPDSEWIVYDTRSDAAGQKFDGGAIQCVNVRSGQVRTLYRTRNGAACGVASWNPRRDKREIVFVHGPENPTASYFYAPHQRRGVRVDASAQLRRPKWHREPEMDAKAASAGVADHPEGAEVERTMPNASKNARGGEPVVTSLVTARWPCRNLDARDLLGPQFTDGALRGGTGDHQYSPDGALVSSSYVDAVLLRNQASGVYGRVETACVCTAVTTLDGRGGVEVDKEEHPRNHDGDGWTVVVSSHEDAPLVGSDGVSNATREAWIGARGYRRAGNGWVGRALAFLGEVHTGNSRAPSHLELFVLDLPAKPRDLRLSERGKPLSGSDTARPQPPPGATQRRLTDTSGRTYPGMCVGPLEKHGHEGPPSPRAGAGKSGGSGKRKNAGPKFWPRSSPCGSRICVVAMDDMCVPQLYLVATGSSTPARLRQLTDLPKPGVQSAFSWSPDGAHIAFVHDGSVCLLTVPGDAVHRGTAGDGGANDDGEVDGEDEDDALAKLMEQENAFGGPDDRGKKRRVKRLTRRRTGEAAPQPQGVTFSPCGKYVAYVRRTSASSSHDPAPGTTVAPGTQSPKSPLESERDGDNADLFYNSDDDAEGGPKYFNRVCVVGIEVVLRQPFRLAAQIVGTAATVLVGVIATDLAKLGVGALRDGLRRRRVEMLRKIGRRGRGRGKQLRTDTWQDFQREYERTGRRLEKKPKRPAAAKGWDDFKREYER